MRILSHHGLAVRPDEFRHTLEFTGEYHMPLRLASKRYASRAAHAVDDSTRVGIVFVPPAHRQAVSSLQDKDLTPDG
jgi:hypothetical protein